MEVDLIPADYRLRLWQGRVLKWWVACLLVTCSVSAALAFTLRFLDGDIKTELTELKRMEAVTAHHEQRLKSLTETDAKLSQKHARLDALNAGVVVHTLLEAVDRSLTELEIWFVDWRLQHQPIEGAEVTTMHITGESFDHVAVSNFVQRLIRESSIHDVRVLGTSNSRHAVGQVVRFQLSVVVESPQGKTHGILAALQSS